MALTRDFKDTVQARARRDPAFRQALLEEGVRSLLAGEVEASKAILRDGINATIGLEELAGSPPGCRADAKAALRPFRKAARLW